MPIRSPRTHLPTTLIEGAHGQRKKVLVHQVPAVTSKVSVYTINVSPAPPTNAFSNGSTINADLIGTLPADISCD